MAGVYTGLAASVVLLALGPTLWIGDGPSPIDLSDPTIVAMPLGFAGCILGSLLTSTPRRAVGSTSAIPATVARRGDS